MTSPISTTTTTTGRKGLSLASLIVGIASVVLGWFPLIGIAGGIVAIVLGILGRRREAAKGMSLAGIILGAVGLLIGIIFLILNIVAVSAVLNNQ